MSQLKNKFQPKVSIVFVNWNGKKDTFELLDSLKKIAYKNYEIVVVDNGSSENIKKDFDKRYKKFATLIISHKNLGLAEGTNVGIREGLKRRSKYVLVMNNDMYVDKNFLNLLVEKMEKHSEAAVAGPKIYYTNPKNMIWSAGCDYHIWGFKSRFQNQMDKGQAEEEEYVDGIDCVLMMRSSVLKKIGLLDKDFFIMDEFTEWCLRATKNKFKCLFVPNSKVWHKVSSSLKKEGSGNRIGTYYWSRNWLLDIKKNKNFFYFLFVFFLHLTIFAIYRGFKYILQKRFFLIKDYYIGAWHMVANKTVSGLYSG